MLSINLEKKEKEGENPTLNFEEIFDQYDYKLPKRGQIIEGEIQTIEEDAVILDVGLKRAAFVPKREVSNLDEEVLDDLTIGDVIPIKVIQTPVGDDDLLVSIDDAREVESWQKAQDCLDKDQVLELEVTGSNRGGVLVSFDRLEGFVPNSQLPTLRKVYDRQQALKKKRQMQGSKIDVKVIDVDPPNERLVLSALAAQEELRQERLANMSVGDVITGTVLNIVDFGMFVDLGGIDGLVHISELDWKNIAHPSEIAQTGDTLEVQIVDIDRARERVSLSRKALIPGPWDEVETKYNPGDLVPVRITNVVDFGAFGELSDGLQGLIHTSELGYTVPGAESDAPEPGETVFVKILRIEPERERIGLSMRQVPAEKQLDWMLGDLKPVAENAPD